MGLVSKILEKAQASIPRLENPMDKGKPGGLTVHVTKKSLTQFSE